MSIVAKVDVRGYNAVVHGGPPEPFVTASHHFSRFEMRTQVVRREQDDGREYFTLSLSHSHAGSDVYLSRSQAREIVDELARALAAAGEGGLHIEPNRQEVGA